MGAGVCFIRMEICEFMNFPIDRTTDKFFLFFFCFLFFFFLMRRFHSALFSDTDAWSKGTALTRYFTSNHEYFNASRMFNFLAYNYSDKWKIFKNKMKNTDSILAKT